MLDFGFYNADCMEHLKDFPDGYFDLAIVDPPYGAGLTENGGCQGWFSKYHQNALNKNTAEHGEHYNRFGSPGSRFEKFKRPEAGETAPKIIAWDTAPDQSYFEELFRVSRNQIIWGGNYFDLPPTRCFIVWRKLTISENFSMAMAEYAWTSFSANAKVYEAAPQDPTGTRFHPTQKPVGLYLFCLKHFAKPGDKILDTHVGSGSSLVACDKAGFKYVGFEIDEEYYAKAKARIDAEKAQYNIFDYMGKDDD